MVYRRLAVMAPEIFPGLPLVGYEHGVELAAAHHAGFKTVGSLRVWRRGAELFDSLTRFPVFPSAPKPKDRFGRVEDGRGSLGPMANAPFPIPLIKPDEPISGIRLSDWLHREARDGAARGSVGGTERRVLDE